MDTRIRIGAQVINKISYALQQNKVPLFRDLSLYNIREEDTGTLRLKLSYDTSIIRDFSQEMPALSQGHARTLGSIVPQINPQDLLALTETLQAKLVLSIEELRPDTAEILALREAAKERRQAGEPAAHEEEQLQENLASTESEEPIDESQYTLENYEIQEQHLELRASALKEASMEWIEIHRHVFDLEILCYNQWTGMQLLPEMTAAFVTPNTPMVQEIVNAASHYMQQWTGTPSFLGYQDDDKNQVLTQITAIYAALQAHNLAYRMAPASFGQLGQRVRLPDDVLLQKQGNCIELALLFASCLEAIGLHPLIVMVRGHAFCACWLEARSFPEILEYSRSQLTKVLSPGIDQLRAFECTTLTAGMPREIEHAMQAAQQMLEQNEPAFIMAVDLVRARSSDIRPVPLQMGADHRFEHVDYGKRKASQITGQAKDRIEEYKHITKEGARSKEDVWARSLLDLSLRNRLLNYRFSSTVLQILSHDLHALEDAMADGHSFSVHEKPEDLDCLWRDVRLAEFKAGPQGLERLSAHEFQNKRLRTPYTKREVDKRLKNLYRAAKKSLDEDGANSLFLALGFLRFHDGRDRYAPLVLLPIDIIRSNTRGSYAIRMRDEEAQFNVSLTEYLKQKYEIEIKGLEELPTDEKGVDLQRVFSLVRRSIMGKKDWEVESHAVLGILSFARFMMWNDLKERRQEITAHPIVEALIKGYLPHRGGAQALELQEHDQQLRPDSLALLSPIDSSQLAAVASAASGESFVLHGPPGTGKSQTITNIIATALYQGKRVLFVAEKMAALDVVYRRLEGLGLGDFCMELHSNKANKADILRQLKVSLDRGLEASAEDFSHRADQIMGLRQQMNEIIAALHAPHRSGRSFYDYLLQYSQLDIPEPPLHLDQELFAEATAKELEAFDLAVRAYQNALLGLDCPFHEHPLKAFRSTTSTLMQRHELSAALRRLIRELDQLEASVGESPLILEDQGFFRFAKALREAYPKKIPSYHPALAAALEDVESQAAIQESLALLKALQAEKAKLLASYREGVLELSPSSLRQDYLLAKESFFIGQKRRMAQALAPLQAQALEAERPEAQALEDLAALEALQQKTKAFERLQKRLAPLFPAAMLHEGQDPKRLEKLCEEQRYLERMAKIAKIAPSFLAERLAQVAKLPEAFDRLAAEVVQSFGLFQRFQIYVRPRSPWLPTLREALQNWDQQLLRWREMAYVQKTAAQLKAYKLDALVQAVETQGLASKDVHTAYQAAFIQSMVHRIMSQEPLLQNFNGQAFEHQLAKYRQENTRFMELTQQEVVARIAAQIPRHGGQAADSSQFGILRRAVQSRGRMTSLRKVFQDIPSLLPRLIPCMLMSPISVAQYIDPAHPKFDLVVFDEASQIQTCMAVGAIARGKSLIVVGDPKQLPPTTFFQMNYQDEEHYELEDLESLLDDCIAIAMPERHLRWHYRSRHESLIQFSNSQYYEDQLSTFPTPRGLASEVQFIPCEGVYGQGSSRDNLIEAKAVVAEILRRLKDPVLRQQSLGVVCFNIPQQHLIDDLLMAEFAQAPDLAAYNDQMDEPLFIKNIESVQGDERDVILFSICYGPNEAGRISMSFGPINKEGGWRRLNVAVSRAREQMLIFSSLAPEDIDLSRSRAEGVKGLKRFLAYAKTGHRFGTAVERPSAKDLRLEDIAAHHLRQRGHKVQVQLGSSDFKVPIGIEDPDHPGEFLLGILIDGPDSYHKASARDRHLSQPGFLKHLGWELFWLWSLDWLDHPETVLDAIDARVDELLEARAKDAAAAVAPPSKLPPLPPSLPVQVDAEQASEVMEAHEVEAPPSSPMASQLEDLAKAPTEAQEVRFQALPYPAPAADLPRYDSTDFYETTSLPLIMQCMHKILEAEAPILRGLLYRQVLKQFQIGRLGSRVEAQLEKALKETKVLMEEDGPEGPMDLLRLPGAPLADWRVFRPPSSEEGKRQMDEIPIKELQNAACHLLETQFGMSQEDLIRETARCFGFARVGAKIRNRMNEAIQGLIEDRSIGCEAATDDPDTLLCSLI